VAAASAEELRALGVTMNLAPVVDVNTNPLNPVIGVRSFGSTPDLVSLMGVATLEGLQGGGVSAVAKHFPGHGDTSVDSHRDLPVVAHSLERLQQVELAPFRAMVAAGVDGIMTAHVFLPSVEPRENLPATLSRNVLTGLLREQMGYQGLILTDALDMGAIKKDRSAAEAAVVAFQAGADVLLIAGIEQEDRARLAEGPAAMLAAVQSGRVSEERLNESVLRILEAKARRGLLDRSALVTPVDLSPVGSAAHQALALDAARKAITVQRDDAHLLPLDPSRRILVVEPGEMAATAVEEAGASAATSLSEAVRAFAPGVETLRLPRGSQAAQEAVARARSADVVVLATYDLARGTAQQAVARALLATSVPLVMVEMRGPYDASALPDVKTVVAAYGDRPVHLQAAAEALFGAFQPSGVTP
jgi:beta-N-acetylhexosaminidase